jgi:hypothetical protein
MESGVRLDFLKSAWWGHQMRIHPSLIILYGDNTIGHAYARNKPLGYDSRE